MTFTNDTEGVSEVLGEVFIFGILSVMMILSLIAFAAAQSAVQVRAVDLTASSAAARVAGVLVQVAVVAERDGNATLGWSNVTYRVDLPSDLQGVAYTVALQPAGVESVWANATSKGVHESTDLFSAGQPLRFDLAKSTIGGGPMNVRFDDNVACPNHATHKPCLYLEITR
ncbi:MAG: hypothetical protein ACYDBQ_09425 [Thermoplasmatota archaeon]